MIIDELPKKSLLIKSLDAILCSYIHYRVTERSTVFPMSIQLIIDTSCIALEDCSEDDFLGNIKYVASKLQLDTPIIQMANKKIYIALY